ncbi:MAG: AI-2E family transporter [Verrucomicrobiota bacterium]|nr:AI-2E family transporter [Verrucomicrobiota bacterium]
MAPVVAMLLGGFALLLVCWYAIEVLLFIFIATLLATGLRGLSCAVSRRLGLGVGWSLALVTLLIIGAFVAGTIALAPELGRQGAALIEALPKGLQSLQTWVESTPWGREITARLGSTDWAAVGQRIVSGATGVLSSTVSAIAGLLIIVILTLYLAADPDTYLNGVLRLARRERRPRLREVSAQLGQTLRDWLQGQLIAMLLTGVLTTLGLWLLGIPLPLALGVIVALFGFIPNIGPIIGVVPAALLALTKSPMSALWVLVLYFVIQTVEGNLITPMIQQRAVRLPPALTLGAQIFLGSLLGILGVFVATPLAAVVLVLVGELYVKDVLGDDDEEDSETRREANRHPLLRSALRWRRSRPGKT